jgi:pyruvoyl-dependent arginine decarboxylase (PvlArgDC)
LSLTIAAGTGTSTGFYYQDTRAGSHVLTASAAGVTSGAQTVAVLPGPVTALTITPASAAVRARASQPFAAAGTDAHGNPVQVAAAWSLMPPTLGTIAPKTGTATTFTAGRTLGTGTVTAAIASETGTISAGASVTVTPGRLRIGWIKYKSRKKIVLVNVRVVDAAGQSVSRAQVSVLVRRNGRRYFSARAVTGAGGRTFHRVPVRRDGCFVTTIRRVSAAGFAWDGRTPRNRFCT